MAFAIKYAVKGVASGIGYVREAQHASKERKLSSTLSSTPELPASSASALLASGKAVPIDESVLNTTQETSTNETDWELDEAAAGDDERNNASDEEEESKKPGHVEGVIQKVMKDMPPPPETALGIPCPVLLPQRRPKDKERGWIRAYAPVLEDCGIDQASWLRFVDGFDTARKAHPIFNIIILGASIAGVVPEPIIMITTNTIILAARAGGELHSRKRANSYLDTLNEILFKPRGLYCMIMKFDPKATGVHSETLSISNKVVKTSNEADSSSRKIKNAVRTHDAKTKGEMQLPNASPLVFPALDEKMQKEGFVKENKKVLVEYKDKRAQAIYMAKNPDSKLGEHYKPKFVSRYSDPNHPASSGSLIALVSGGKITEETIARRSGGVGLRGGRGGVRPVGRVLQGGGYGDDSGRRGLGGLRERGGLGRGDRGIGLGGGPLGLIHAGIGALANRGQRSPSDDRGHGHEGQYAGGGYAEQDVEESGSRAQGRQGLNSQNTLPGILIGSVKKLITPDVLYLMVVNLPSEEELAAAREAMERE